MTSPTGAEPRRFLRDLDRPGEAIANLGPNWFASVMGTGIVAVAAVTLPIRIPGLFVFATIVWLLASLMLAWLIVAWVLHWRLHPQTARRYITDPVLAQFFGAPPMALMTVELGTLLIGQDLLGSTLALTIAWALWSIGTLTGLGCAVIVPYVMFTRGEVRADGAFGGWLMPVVPPMVSATFGAALVGYLPAGEWQLTMVICCYAMFGISLFASIIITTLIWNRLLHHPMLPALMVPTLWIVLGPLGQSITAANRLSADVVTYLSGPLDTSMTAFGLLYGIPTWGFALFWAVMVAAITVRTVREKLPFGLSWWSFTFPVGTMVTGTSALAATSGAAMFEYLAVVFFFALLAAWFAVAIRTARRGYRGSIFLAAGAGPAPAP